MERVYPRAREPTMKRTIEIDRRKVLGTVGGLAMAGSGMAFFAGSAAAGDTSVSDAGTQAITTDDGSIHYVAFGGKLRYEWDGLDEVAEYGEYRVRARIHNGNGWSRWHDFGSTSGPLGEGNDDDDNNRFQEGEGNTSATFGGTNDSNSGPGTDGFFQFKYGAQFGQPSYAIAYNSDVANNPGDYGENGLRPVGSSKFDLAQFEAENDGATQSTTVQFEFTCRVLDADENVINQKATSTVTAQMPVKVTNKPAEGHTSGRVDGEVGGDTS